MFEFDSDDIMFDIEEDEFVEETLDFSDCIKSAKSTNGNGGIEFNFDQLFIEVWGIDRRIGKTSKYYHFKNQNDERFIYFQKITRMLELLSKYKYPVDIRFKNLDNATSDLIFLYEGQEVEVQDIETLYNSLNKRINEIEEIGDKKLLWDLTYSGEYKNVQEQNVLVDRCRVGSLEEEKKNKRIFDKLIEQYNLLIESLPTEEREQLENSLLVYNTCLYEVINQLVAIPNFREQNSNDLFAELLESPSSALSIRLFIRSLKYGKQAIEKGDKSFNEEVYKRLGIVNCSSKESFVQSLISIYDTITKYSDELQLPEDVYLYRGISVSEEKQQSSVARSELISTSLDRNVAKRFFRESKTPTMFVAKVKKGTNFMIVPYKFTSCAVSYKKGKELVKYNGVDYDSALENREVILFDSRITSKETNISIIDEGIRRITVVELDMKSREKEETQKNVQDLWKETVSSVGEEISYIDSTDRDI